MMNWCYNMTWYENCEALEEAIEEVKELKNIDFEDAMDALDNEIIFAIEILARYDRVYAKAMVEDLNECFGTEYEIC